MLVPEFKVIGVDETQERIRASTRAITKGKFDSLRKGTIYLERQVRLSINRNFERHTGNFISAVNSAVFVTGLPGGVTGGMAGVVGTPHVAGRIQEYGGTIRPKNAKALTIPLNKQAAKSRAKDFSDLFIVKAEVTRGGVGTGRYVGMLARKKGKRGNTVIAMYALFTSVTIKPKGYMEEARYISEPYLVDALDRVVNSAIESN